MALFVFFLIGWDGSEMNPHWPMQLLMVHVIHDWMMLLSF